MTSRSYVHMYVYAQLIAIHNEQNISEHHPAAMLRKLGDKIPTIGLGRKPIVFV